MRTNNIKAMAEDMEGEYEEWYENQLKEGVKPDDIMDIFTWVGMEFMTAQEEHNDFLRDEGLIR